MVASRALIRSSMRRTGKRSTITCRLPSASSGSALAASGAVADALMVTAQIFDHPERVRSFETAAEVSEAVRSG